MMYSDEILQQVKRFGVLQYSIEKIVSILNPLSPLQFVDDIRAEETTLYAMYHSGLDSGQYNLDAAEFRLKSSEADKAALEVARFKKMDGLINEFCGYDN